METLFGYFDGVTPAKLKLNIYFQGQFSGLRRGSCNNIFPAASFAQ